MTRVLIISASIGEGHDLPARFLAEDVRSLGGEAIVADGLAAMGPLCERIVASGSAFESEWGARIFEAQYWAFTHVPPLRAFTGWGSVALGGRQLLRIVASVKPDVVVSTYPGTSEILGRLRAAGRLDVPAASAITDLAALRYWSHPGLDAHLVTHPESVEEVRAIAGPATAVVPARGMNDPAFCAPRGRDDARRALALPLEPKVVVVSGGGWGVGDVEGAVRTALGVAGAHVVVMCGRNDGLRTRISARFADEPRVRVLGFTDQVPDLFAAADALVHSTAGLTVLEAIQRGCPAISYGWGRGHIRANNRAFTRFGLAEVAATPAELAVALRRALAERREPDLSFAALPSAGSVLLGMHQPAAGGCRPEPRGARRDDDRTGEGDRAPVLAGQDRRGEDRDDHLRGDDDRRDAGGGDTLQRGHLGGQGEQPRDAGDGAPPRGGEPPPGVGRVGEQLEPDRRHRVARRRAGDGRARLAAQEEVRRGHDEPEDAEDDGGAHGVVAVGVALGRAEGDDRDAGDDRRDRGALARADG